MVGSEWERWKEVFGGAGPRLPDEEGIQGEEAFTPYGPCRVYAYRTPFSLPIPERGQAEALLAQALGLVYGVGPVWERDLRAQGFRTLGELGCHPRFGGDAARWARTLGQADLLTLYRGICRWYSPSHPLLLALLGLADPEDIVFLDLESLGLSNLPVFLAAVGKLTGDALVVWQFLARSLAEEAAVLTQVTKELPPVPVVVTYNGKAHDWNQLRARVAYYGLPPLPEPVHLDLLFFARRRWAGSLEDCSLAQVERRVLQRTREEDLPSELVPLYYQAYLQTGASSYLRPVVSHNREDVVALALLLKRVLEDGDS